MNSSKPLWRVKKDSNLSPPTTATEEQCYAAEIRAIADEIECNPEANRCTEWGDVADWLRSEADKAEADE